MYGVQGECMGNSFIVSKLYEESLDINKLNNFFESQLFDKIITSDKYIKECRFVSQLNVSEIDPNIVSDQTTVIDGVADLVVFKDGKITIIDFKTDRVDNEQQLVERYSKQLDLYAKSFETIYKCQVENKIIYSFYLSKSVQV